MKTAAAYIRVSTEDQVEYSPASQLEKIREYAKHNDYIIPNKYIFIDEGISGRHTQKRIAFNKMICIAKSIPKPFDAILLWKFSRFARNREDSIVYKSMLRKQCGIDVISISENLSNDKISVLIEALIEAMDEYYSLNLSEEVKRGMTEKVNRGEAVTIPSFGYNIKNGQYIPDEETAPIVKRIFYDYISGKDIQKIAREISNDGYRTKRGNRFENRTIQYILSNPVYIGKIRWTPTGKIKRNSVSGDTIITDGKHEPLIDRDIWNKTQEKLKSMEKTKYTRQKSAKNPFMLQGLVRCSSCGATLCRAFKYTSLQCCAYSRGKCTVSHSISIKKINDMVIRAFEKSDLADCFDIEIRPVNNNRKYNIPYLIEREHKKNDRIKDAYENGIYTLDEFKQKSQQILNKISELEKNLLENKDSNKQTERKDFQNKPIKILPVLRSPTVSEENKNSLLKSFVKRIIFYRSDCSIDIFLYK